MQVSSCHRRFNHHQTSVADPSLRALTYFMDNTGMSGKRKRGRQKKERKKEWKRKKKERLLDVCQCGAI